MSSQTIVVGRGLVLDQSPIEAAPGTVLAMLNYEFSKDGKLRSIEGYRPYSGGSVYNIESSVGLTIFSMSSTSVTWGTGKIRLPDGSIINASGRARTKANSGFVSMGAIQGRLPNAGEVIDSQTGWFIGSYPDYVFANLSVSPSRTVHYQMSRLGIIEFSGVGPYSADTLLFQSSIGYPPGCFYWQDNLYVVADHPAVSFTTTGSATAAPPARGQTVYIDNSGVLVALVIERVIIETGVWSDDTATGTIWFSTNLPDAVNAALSLPDSAAITTYNVYEGLGPSNLMFIATKHANPAGAGLQKETGPFGDAGSGFADGFTQVDLGHEVRFAGGANQIAFVCVNRKALDESITTPTATAATLPGTATSTYWTNINNVLADDAAVTSVASGTANIDESFTVTNFGFAIPTYSVITGVQVHVERHTVLSGGGTKTIKDRQIILLGQNGVQGQNRAAQDTWPTGALAVKDYGSSQDLWGLELSPAIVNSSSFGVRVGVSASTAGVNTATAEIDCVKITVHYKPYESTIYFYDTVALADVAIGSAVWFYKDKGDYDTDDAEGILTVYGLTETEANAIGAGNRIMSGAGNTGSFYGVAGGPAARVYLPPSTACETENSQYEFVTGNFHGTAQYEQVFGVSGAGFGFSYDGKYLIRIRTGYEENIDKPRHVAKHGYQLAFGYGFGDVVFSDIGEPESFANVTNGSSPVSDVTLNPDFLGGSTQYGLSDGITGFVPLQEQSLGVFCKESIRRIDGTAGSFTDQVVRPESGAIEYSVRSLGGILIYADFRGVGVLSPSDLFGQLTPRYVSADVSSFLTPRLRQSGNSRATMTGFVTAAAFRSKNQYRMYFRDGLVLTMTLVGNEFVPNFSLQDIQIDLRATCIGVHSSGVDVSFFTVAGPQAQRAFTGRLHVYQADSGSTFADSAGLDVGINKFALINIGTCGNASKQKKFNGCAVEAGAYGFAAIGARFCVDSSIPTPYLFPNAYPLRFGGEFITSADQLEVPQKYLRKVDAGAQGYAAMLYVEDKPTSGEYGGTDPSSYHKYQMPHTINTIVVDYTIIGKNQPGR